MPLTVAAVIPTLNEEARVAEAVASAFRAGVDEVIVSDGGSSDETVERARAAGARVLTGEKMRSRQANAGAAAATTDVVVFLHGDTLLPERAAEAIAGAISSGYRFGGFRISFLERVPKLRLAAALINLRTSLTRCPWGDQAQFVARKEFLEEGGFREMPIMEDYELALRMKKSGKTTLLRQCVATSGRRFLQKGVLATAVTNWRVIIAWRMGADPATLYSIYRNGARPPAPTEPKPSRQ